jgi:hypothetical protein
MILALLISTWDFTSPLPIWLCLILGCATLALTLNSHRSIRPRTGLRSARTLPILRAFTIGIATTMLLAPTYVSTTLRHTRGPLLLILDDSRSMNRVDSPQNESRSAQAQQALNAIEPTLNQFDVQVIALSNPIASPPTAHWPAIAHTILANPTANQSPIGETLHRITAESSNPTTILLVSDGRQTNGADPIESARALSAHGSKLFTLSVGSPEPIRDASVEFIDAPHAILTGDDVSLTATIRLDAIQPNETITATFTRDGQAVDRKPLPATPISQVNFIDHAPSEGDHTYQITLTELPGEASTQNNRLAAQVSVTREKINVLLIEDEPRWEYQFLRTLLLTDHRVALQSALLQPAHIRNIPTTQPASIPSTPQAWSTFEVIILGDVAPQNFTLPQQSQLAAALKSAKPKCLIVIAGPRNMPSRFAGSPLATLLPVDLSKTSSTPDQLSQHSRQGFQPAPAPEALTSILARLLPDDQLNQSAWSALPPFYWHDDHTSARPGATIIWQIDRPSGPPLATSTRQALLATMMYGAGKVLYLATPETWRMRYVPTAGDLAEDLHRRFWAQALRWAVAGEPAHDDSRSRDLEDRNQSADPQRMQAIAKAGNGACLDVANVANLAAALPARDHTESNVSRIGILEDPRAATTRTVHWSLLLILIALLTAEWSLRKRRGLI